MTSTTALIRLHLLASIIITPHLFCAWLCCIFDQNLAESSDKDHLFSPRAQPCVSNFTSQTIMVPVSVLTVVYSPNSIPPPFAIYQLVLPDGALPSLLLAIQFLNQRLHLNQGPFKPRLWTGGNSPFLIPRQSCCPTLINGVLEHEAHTYRNNRMLILA